MTDPRVDKLADILVNYSIKVKPRDWVAVMANVQALPLARAVIKHVLRAGGQPTHFLADDEIDEVVFREASDEQLQWISPIEKSIIEDADAFISLRATSNTRTMTGVDPKRQQVRQLARRDLITKYMERVSQGNLRWVGTQYPCPALAQEADMSLQEYEDFVYKATYADQTDPISCWQAVYDKQQFWVDWLKGKKEITVRGPDIDLKVNIEGRTFINDHGLHNMPAGEIFTSPVENSATGWVKFNYPAIRGGRAVEGVEFTFEEGKVVQAKATKNEAYLLSQLDSDEGARYLGEFAIGTNYAIDRFTRSILYDEKIGGTVHMAIGFGFPEVGGQNRSTVHWDFICDMKTDSEILVDGELFYKNGAFVVTG